MQMTGDPSPLLRAPPRGFCDKSRRNYNAFNRHVRHFCNKCLITRPWPAFATASQPIASTATEQLTTGERGLWSISAGENDEWLLPIVDRSLRWSECAGCHGTGRVRAPTEEPL